MLRDITFPKSNEYRSGTSNEPINFFLEALSNSNSFDLLLGYFSSSAVNVLSLGFATFIHKGGKVRIIANHILSSKDKEAIIKGNKVSEDSFSYNVKDYKRILNSLDEYGTHFFNCLAWLISSNRIEMKIVKPRGSKGISHYKSGVFLDDKHDKVKFKSSCNFTAFGLLENLEELEVKKSWSSESDDTAISDYENYFNSIFNKEVDFVEYVPFDEIEEAILKDFGNKNIQELLVDELGLLEKRKSILEKGETKIILDRLTKEINSIIDVPKFKPRGYQIQAYKNWIANNYKGMFAMATGTGKTFTSLNCILNEYKLTGSHKAIVLVPTIELVNQWKKEIEKFQFKNLVTVSSKNKSWRDDLNRISTLAKTNNKYSFFIISTYNSFTNKKFQSILKKLPKETVFIADEAHNLGSPSRLPLLEDFPLKKRLGLSATPERIYDEEGSQAVDLFFNDNRPYTCEFSMEEALEKEYLCQYKYHPHIVELNETELNAYVAYSKELAKYFDKETNNFKEGAKKILLLRKQIIHKSSNKLALFDDLLNKIIQEDKLKYTLVYAPEGFFNEDHFQSDSDTDFQIDEHRICEFYASRIRKKSPNSRVALFNSQTKDRKNLIDKFDESKVDVLVSMKCLDEGVDIPRTEQAIFCASTGNPRQFIQRRGRILRMHDDKSFATIHDMIVVPSLTKISGDFDIEKRLVENELRRVKEFANLAMNKYQAIDQIQNVIDLFNIQTIF